MITVITGLTGSGKTWFMSRLLYKRAKKGDNVSANFNLTFPTMGENVMRWHNLSEIYTLSNGVIGIDEGQKLFDSRMWPYLPMAFAEKIASHRHQGLDIITTTQDFGHIDVKVRQNVHQLYSCRSVFRWPRSDRVKPLLQGIMITKKQRSFDDVIGSIKWEKSGAGKFRLISKFWTKEFYNTYANIDLSHFICQIKRDKKKWLIILQSRQLLNQRSIRH